MEFRRRLRVARELLLIPRRKKKKSSIPDITRSILEVLKESADAFPPLKSTVGGVIAIWDVHSRVKTCKGDVEDLAHRTCEILFGLQEMIGDPGDIHPQTLQSIARFQSLLNKIFELMEELVSTKYLTQLTSLNRNEKCISALKQQLDEMLELFKVCSVTQTELRVLEVCKETSSIRRDIIDIKLILGKVQSKQESAGNALFSWKSMEQRTLKIQLASVILF